MLMDILDLIIDWYIRLWAGSFLSLRPLCQISTGLLFDLLIRFPIKWTIVLRSSATAHQCT